MSDPFTRYQSQLLPAPKVESTQVEAVMPAPSTGEIYEQIIGTTKSIDPHTDLSDKPGDKNLPDRIDTDTVFPLPEEADPKIASATGQGRSLQSAGRQVAPDSRTPTEFQNPFAGLSTLTFEVFDDVDPIDFRCPEGLRPEQPIQSEEKEKKGSWIHSDLNILYRA